MSTGLQKVRGAEVSDGDGGERERVQFPTGLRVLVVDDDPLCLMILERMLRLCHYKGEILFDMPSHGMAHITNIYIGLRCLSDDVQLCDLRAVAAEEQAWRV